MIIYCGLRHFYIHRFVPPRPDAFYILTHKKDVWDFSPRLKLYSLGQIKANGVYHLEKPVFTIPLRLSDFWPLAQKWHAFSRRYTEALEPEYPHSWYLQFKRLEILKQFSSDFVEKLKEEKEGGIWGAGTSKLVAKLAAHNLPSGANFVGAEQTKEFLIQVPLRRLPLPELERLEKLGLKTIGELADLPLAELTAQFGKRGAILQRLGRGEDLLPFQTQPIPDFRWELDCTTLEGFYRPLTPAELDPYLQQGSQELAAALKKHNKVANLLKLEVLSTQEDPWQAQRFFKQPSSDPQVFRQALQSIIPQKPLAHIVLSVSELETAPQTQLNLFLEPPAPKVPQKHAQLGVKLPRREQFLILWKVHLQSE